MIEPNKDHFILLQFLPNSHDDKCKRRDVNTRFMQSKDCKKCLQHLGQVSQIASGRLNNFLLFYPKLEIIRLF